MTRISLLQLDTHFPRIPGDVGCKDTYNCELEIIRVPNATVSDIVTDTPDQIDLGPFFDAITRANGDIITTSCGFLAPFQAELAKACSVPFFSSALGQLKHLKNNLTPAELSIITFNASKLGGAHLPIDCASFEKSIRGLSATSHLRQVIENDLSTLNTTLAASDVCAVLQETDVTKTKGILLECTNLPPYKPAIRKIKPVPIYDILTMINTLYPGAVRSQYL